MMINIFSCSMSGLSPHLVECEVDLSFQLPTLQLVGLPSSVTQESKERIRSAISNSGFEWPTRKVVISLLPADLPKWGSHFELSMAIGVLLCSTLSEELKDLAPKSGPLSSHLFSLGQLSLSGNIQPVGWLTNLAHWLSDFSDEHFRKNNKKLICIFHPNDIQDLCRFLPQDHKCELVSATTLMDAVAVLMKKNRSEIFSNEDVSLEKKSSNLFNRERSDFTMLCKVKNEPMGVTAAMVAVLGRHHCLFAGPHGMGKSMLISAIADALPGLDEDTFLKYVSIQKAFGENLSSAFYRGKPLIHLQSSSTRASVEGAILNSGQVIPGETTRAHLGVLVADEFLEFRRDVLEGLRQILDEKVIRLQRARHRVLLPADFQLLASTNLCPCGSWGTSSELCRCSSSKRNSYQMKLSGPIMDRMDLFVVVGQKKILETLPRELVKMVEQISDPALFKKHSDNYLNAQSDDGEDSLWLWSQMTSLASDRGKLKMARVSKTIARILGEKRALKHLLLAQELRESAYRHFLPRWPVSKRISSVLSENKSDTDPQYF